MAALEDRVSNLRREFDDGFALRPVAQREELVDFLLVRIAAHAYALRLGELGGISKARPLAPLPTRRGDLLGLSGVRGAVVCVYGMAALLGLADEEDPAQWLALGADTIRIALAFHGLEGFVRAPRSSAHDAVKPGGAGALVRGVLTLDGSPRPIVDLPAMFATIRGQPESPALPGEARDA